MNEQATVDAYGESEQGTGWFTMIEENLEVPFKTTVVDVQAWVSTHQPGLPDILTSEAVTPCTDGHAKRRFMAKPYGREALERRIRDLVHCSR